jgi:putative tryptophan/tyrosine transport system substrate-binding protein
MRFRRICPFDCHFLLVFKFRIAMMQQLQRHGPYGWCMRRRDFIAVFCMSAAWPLAVRAQQSSKVYRIALVSPARHLSEMSEDGPDFGIIFRELRRLGYVEGNNLVVLRFSAEGDPARYDPMIHDVVSAAPDVIVTANNPLVLRFKALEHSIPVVAMMGDPLAFGIVASLARPEGNITGISADAGEEIWGKRLAMLLETVPAATHVGFLCSQPFWEGPQGDKVRDAARRFSVTLVAPPLTGVYQEPEYRRVFDAIEKDGAQVLLVSDSVENNAQRRLIVALAERARFPALYPYREFVDVGGLMAYAVDVQEMFRRAADYADMILKGKKPGDLPIYQADKFTTIVNLKTAKALGLTIPPTLLARADDVIE